MSRIRSHVVGSILRTPELLEAREKFAAGQIEPKAFREIEDRAVDRAIAIQESAGIDVITDGEQRRADFMEVIIGAVDGIEDVPTDAAVVSSEFWHKDDPDLVTTPWIPPVITGKLTRRASFAGEEYSYARARATKPIKMTLPSPTVLLSYWSPDHSVDAYTSPQDALNDFATLLRDEVVHLASLGCEQIQLDAPDLTMLLEGGTSFFFESAGFTRESYIDTTTGLLNEIATVPGVTFSVHLCRGNKENEWHSQGGYEGISKEVFPLLKNFEYILLEFDDARSGGFEPLADMPDDKCVVLGLISTKRKEVEDRGEMERRIDEAAKFHPRDQLAVSPQCGFASISYGNPIGLEAEEAKLKLVGALGHEAW